MKATIKDIAKKTNLSVATVSRILNNKTGYFSEKSATKVHKAAEELGYQKNTTAVELVTQTSKVVAVIISSTKTNFADQIIDGIQEVAFENNLNVIFLYAGENDEEIQYKSLVTAIERSVMGIIMVAVELNGSNLDYLQQSRIPYILLSTAHGPKGSAFITTDNYQLGYRATEFLIERGHRKISLVGNDLSDTGTERLRGYKDALKNNHISFNPGLALMGDFSYEDGITAAKKLFQPKLRVTGLIGGSDMVAIGIINQAKELGFSVPEDVSVMSLDGTNITNIYRPIITSAIQPFKEIGKRGMQQLLNTDERPHQSQLLTFNINEGESTRRI
ncbi:LacI family DNA-binding transcriptional regulator [Lentilactobacillus sp. SPB1-3]|uniref:LacI family DNA-binding transcriptional regulator n=1 Tax=Lentilactobacillus terminaliae TaxID=3003483 RepID=A0ACD5DFN7_9LACO|nr:LacI family DNA-binding transcriptional regulator [Lentilactobacillus sp. SPB1-3]MCZ0976452.1 LacI family DNA-binding transcriptional regulator [Lentilactobacillus sp. SPB1-3]